MYCLGALLQTFVSKEACQVSYTSQRTRPLLADFRLICFGERLGGLWRSHVVHLAMLGPGLLSTREEVSMSKAEGETKEAIVSLF